MPATRSSTPSSSSSLRSAAGGGGFARVLAWGLPLPALSIALAAAGDPADHPAWLLASSTLGLAWLAVAARRLAAGAVPVGALLLVAALTRLPLLALPPTLSDDVLRYVWDGRVAASGNNPYRVAPDDPRLAGLRDDLWRSLPHRQVPTVYPPLAVAAFSIAARLPAPVLAWKALLTAVDLAAAAMLVALARHRGVPLARATWYAWNPLVALEVAGMGHVDALGAAALVATALALARGRPAAGAAAAAAGILAKLGPLAALPMWARQSRRPALFLAVSLGLAACALAPVLAATGGLPPGLLTYGVHWEFNGPVYEPLWRLLDGLGADARIKALLDTLKEATGEHELWNRFYPWIYPQLLAKAALGLAMAVLLLRSLAARDPLAGPGRLFGGLLLCAATFYPWYLLWVLPWAALDGRRAWLALAATIPAAYLPQHAGVAYWPWIYLAIWGPFAAVAAGDHLLSSVRRRRLEGTP